MRFKLRLMVAGLCLAVPSLAMASSTSMQTTVKVTGSYSESYSHTAHSPRGLPECVETPGHQNGWVLGILGGRGSALEVWAVNNSAANPSAHNANLATTSHFEVVLSVTSANGAVFKEWTAGRHIADGGSHPSAHQGSGTFSIARVAMSGLPDASQGVKYVLTGSFNATLPGTTTYYGDVNNDNLHANVTHGRVHARASFTCWLPPSPGGGGKGK